MRGVPKKSAKHRSGENGEHDNTLTLLRKPFYVGSWQGHRDALIPLSKKSCAILALRSLHRHRSCSCLKCSLWCLKLLPYPSSQSKVLRAAVRILVCECPLLSISLSSLLCHRAPEVSSVSRELQVQDNRREWSRLLEEHMIRTALSPTPKDSKA